MSKSITAQEARDLAASSKDAADAKRAAKSGPAVDAAMAAIQTAAEDGAYDVRLTVEADVLPYVQTALTSAGFTVFAQKSAAPTRVVTVTWKAP